MSVTMKTKFFCSCWDESPQTKSLSLNAVNLGGVWPDMSSDCVMSYSSALCNLTTLERGLAAFLTFCRPHQMGGHPQKRLHAFCSQSFCQQSAGQKCCKAQLESVKKDFI